MSHGLRSCLVLLSTAFLLSCGGGQKPPLEKPAAASQPASQPAPSAAPAKVEKLKMADNTKDRLAKFSLTNIDFDEKLIKPVERKVLVKLVAAAQILDDIYLDQVSPKNRALRQKLKDQQAPQSVLDYFDVMYGPWDRLEGDEPFVGNAHKPKGAGFYPEDLTKAEIEAWIKAHPKTAKDFRGYFSVIQRKGKELVSVPFSEAYGLRLKKAADLLKEAAAMDTHPALKKYLELRADAFLSNDYYASDMAWMDLGDSPLEVVIGPYEVYEDKLMGYKAAMEAFITLRDPVFSKRLQKISKYNKQLEANLPIPKKYSTKRGSKSPISVVIELFTAGDTRAGVQTLAFNLPNDERVRTEKGSKKVLLKNVGQAKFNKMLVPIAKLAVDEKLLPLITFDTYFTEVLLHEMAHGIGPGKITVDGRATSVNRELKELYPAIEECKADIVGMLSGAYLLKKKVLPQAMKKQLPAAYVAGVFRAVRFGAEEAHAKGVLLAFNYLVKKGAITYDTKTGRYGVNYKTFDKGIRDLARELLMVQAKGSYAESKKLLETYGVITPEMQKVLDRLKALPVDIRPNYTILEKMKSW